MWSLRENVGIQTPSFVIESDSFGAACDGEGGYLFKVVVCFIS